MAGNRDRGEDLYLTGLTFRRAARWLFSKRKVAIEDIKTGSGGRESSFQVAAMMNRGRASGWVRLLLSIHHLPLSKDVESIPGKSHLILWRS
jgi:hypothetical protein